MGDGRYATGPPSPVISLPQLKTSSHGPAFPNKEAICIPVLKSKLKLHHHQHHPPLHHCHHRSNSLSVDITIIANKGSILFNDAFNTFYLQLYDIRHMVKNHSDSERGNLLPPHRLHFPISSNSSFICIIPQREITHTTAFVTPVAEHWLETKWLNESTMYDRSADQLKTVPR